MRRGKATAGAVLGIVVIVLIIVAVAQDDEPPLPVAPSQDEAALRGRLLYLADIDDVAWVEFEGNNVYVGFSTLPDDWRNIINAAALHGNREIDFGVHVWAADANQFPDGWRPGDGPHYGEVTARYGKIE